MKVPLSVALLLLGAAGMGKAQPPCPVRLARHGPATKTVMAGRGLTTTVKVTNTGRETVVVNVAIRLPDNVCASKDGTGHTLLTVSVNVQYPQPYTAY